MNYMKVSYVIVLFSQDKEYCVSEFNELGQVVIVGKCSHLDPTTLTSHAQLHVKITRNEIK